MIKFTYIKLNCFLSQKFVFFSELETPDELKYNFYPIQNRVINFKIRSPHDAHIALTSAPADGEPIVEIFIGGWGNTKSVIRRNKQKPERAETETPDILNAGEFRGFWIRWTVDNVGHFYLLLSIDYSIKFVYFFFLDLYSWT